jgi:serine/threonine protein kinase
MSRCIPAEQLQRLLSDDLGDAERQTVESHVDGCPQCQATLLGLVEDSTEVERRVLHARPPLPSPDAGEDFLRHLGETPPAALRAPAGGKVVDIHFPHAPTARGPLGRLESFHVIKELGRGGSGMVFQAHDDELDCLVALKVLRPHLAASPADRARFLDEARKAAAVRHDHIVTLHRVGSAPDFALPYFVMEYVDGEALSDRLRQGPLAPREAATIARQVALALAAAHAKGVVHRDIKPSNIMLERDSGRAKITDFGLAKRLDVDLGQTQSGAIVGTPSYMAPEQAAGKTKEIGPPADVYALGAVLYEMLTARPPFLGTTLLDTLQQVVSEEAVPPRRLQPTVPRDLETICLKCLQKEPRRRYASTSALAEDLRRFLAGEPIQARPTGVWERGIKWARRRPTAAALVAVCALATVSLVVTLAVSNLRIGQEKDRADANYRLAETRRHAAEASLETALDAVERMLTRVGGQQLATVPQTEGLRRRLLEDALDLQRQLLDDHGADPAVRLRTGRGYRVLGTIYELRGDFKEAKAHYDRARAVLQQLAEEAPGVAAYQRQLALVCRDQGRLLFLHRSRNPEASAAYAQAMQLFQKLVDAYPDVALYRAELAKSQNGWCAVAKMLGNHGAADAVYEQMEILLVPLVAAFPGEEDYLWQLASLYHNRGDGLYRRGRVREAEEPTRKAVEMLETLLTKAPDVPAYRRDQVNSLVALGMTLIANGKPFEAEPFLRRGRKLVDKLIADYPTVLGYKNLRSTTLHWLGRMFRAMGRLGEAEEALSEAVQTWRNLVKQYPREPAHRHRLAMSLLRLGGICRDRGRLEEAFKILSEALDLYSQHVREFPRDVGNRLQLAATWHSVGTVVFRQKNYTKAEEAFGQALAILEPLSAKAPAVPAYRRDLANTRAHLGKTLLASGRSEGAARAFAQALPGWRDLVAAEPGSSDYRNGLAETLAEMGDHEGAVKEAAELVRIGQGQAATFCAAADVLAVCVRTVLADTSVPEARRRELGQAYADQAMDLLRKAVQKGYQGIGQFQNNPDLDPLRSRADFKKLLAELKEKAKAGAK